MAKTPAAIEIKKTKAIGSRVAIAAMAGPGHSPTSPQPTPKSEAPIIILLSSFCFFGKFIWFPKAEVSLFFNRKKNGPAVSIPPPMTKINEASQLWAILRKPMTFSGLVIPEITNPIPKITPEIREINLSFISISLVVEE